MDTTVRSYSVRWDPSIIPDNPILESFLEVKNGDQFQKRDPKYYHDTTDVILEYWIDKNFGTFYEDAGLRIFSEKFDPTTGKYSIFLDEKFVPFNGQGVTFEDNGEIQKFTIDFAALGYPAIQDKDVRYSVRYYTNFLEDTPKSPNELDKIPYRYNNQLTNMGKITYTDLDFGGKYTWEDGAYWYETVSQNTTKADIKKDLTAIEIIKEWEDLRLGNSTPAVTFKLLADGEPAYKWNGNVKVPIGDLILQPGQSKINISHLPYWNDNSDPLVPIVYTVEEVQPEGYTQVAYNRVGNRFTFTNAEEEVNLSVVKTAIKVTSKDDIQYDSISYKEIGDKIYYSFAITNNGNIKVTEFTIKDDKLGLNKVIDLSDSPLLPGETYTYEDNSPYEVTQHDIEAGKVSNVVYIMTPGDNPTTDTEDVLAKTKVAVTKIWNDNENQKGKRPESIKVKLVADGLETGDELILNEENNWSGHFSDLEQFKGENKIIYTVGEEIVSDYIATIEGDASTGFTITNNYSPEITDVSGSKIWNDNNNEDGKRPNEITVRLLADGVEVDSKVVTEADEWAWTFSNLEKYKDDQKIIYTITEDLVSDYTSEVNGYNLTNTYTPRKTQVNVTKSWNDNNNEDGKRPESIKVKLVADGLETGDELILNEENNWSGHFSDLEQFKGENKIIYTVGEEIVSDYIATIEGDASTGFTITNNYNPEITDVSGSKIWNDNNNEDGKRPNEITVRLLADGVEVDSKVVTEADEWAWNFSNLEKYKDDQEIIYTITEDLVSDYTSEVNGYNLTNTYTPRKTQVNVTKSWNDNNNEDGKRPDSIVVRLLANDKETNQELVLNEKNNWSGSFTNLEEFNDGKNINYSVRELPVDNYSSSVTGDINTGYIITNIYSSEKTEVSGSKTWKDNNNKDKDRAKEITIRLYADGVEIDKKIVTEANGWKWNFNNLPKYKDGKLIKYTITEDKVDGYITKVNGYNVTNVSIPPILKKIPRTGFASTVSVIPMLALASAFLLVRKNKEEK